MRLTVPSSSVVTVLTAMCCNTFVMFSSMWTVRFRRRSWTRVVSSARSTRNLCPVEICIRSCRVAIAF